MEVHQRNAEPWRVTLVDTGEETMTGGRLKRVAPYLKESTFCFTYGDGVGDINIADSIAFHQQQGKYATVTAAQPPGRFGLLGVEGDSVQSVHEKPNDGGWINGGFFVLEPEVLTYIADDVTIWEREPMENLARDNQLAAYKHLGFWQPMDTLRDKALLEELWASSKAPWKLW
jgi:glucose-1-phosphate cytidylyltransferase